MSGHTARNHDEGIFHTPPATRAPDRGLMMKDMIANVVHNERLCCVLRRRRVVTTRNGGPVRVHGASASRAFVHDFGDGLCPEPQLRCPADNLLISFSSRPCFRLSSQPILPGRRTSQIISLALFLPRSSEEVSKSTLPISALIICPSL